MNSQAFLKPVDNHPSLAMPLPLLDRETALFEHNLLQLFLDDFYLKILQFSESSAQVRNKPEDHQSPSLDQ